MSGKAPNKPKITLLDTHITAALMGVAIGEILSFISFDIRLIRAMIRMRRVRPMPLAYLTARYAMLTGLTALACLAIPNGITTAKNDCAIHWLRTLIVPIYLTSTSAVIGYRALVLHFERPRLISALIHTLLALELLTGFTVSTLARIEPANTSHTVDTGIVPQAWICAPLVIAMMIDAIFTLIVVIPILHRDGRPRKGQVVHMLLSDALFFGLFSIAVKAAAIGVTLHFVAKGTNPYLAIRMEAVASTVFACRLFRGQETFLKTHMERKAQPSLKTIEADVNDGEQDEAQMDEEGTQTGDSKRRRVRLTLTDCLDDSEPEPESERPKTADPLWTKKEEEQDTDPEQERERSRNKYDKLIRSKLRAAFLAV